MARTVNLGAVQSTRRVPATATRMPHRDCGTIVPPYLRHIDGRSPAAFSSSEREWAVQSEIPQVLTQLLQATDESSRDSAWRAFVAEYSRLLLYVARRNTPDYDASMDAYTFVLEKLGEHELRRLRSYVADGRGKFTTWLVVVTRRLCLDYHRHRYGRATSADPDRHDDERAARRRLVDLTLSKDEDALAARESGDDQDVDLRRAELQLALDQAMNELPGPDRLLLALRFNDGMSAAEIASLLHYASPFHVYRRINQLLAELRRRLVGRGVQSSAP